MDTPSPRAGLGVLGAGAAACAVCCVGPILGFLAATGIASVLGAVAFKQQSVQHPSESHALIRPFAGSSTWVFGVDGDEIYEPDRLARLRQKIFSGDFDKYWMLLGNVLHATKLATDRRRASGHFAPPCRSMTKLYNFGAIESWGGYTPERLHGGDVRFRNGFTDGDRRMLHEEVTWDEADFRCLHLCFLKRSTLDNENTSRPNIIRRRSAPRACTRSGIASQARSACKSRPSGNAAGTCGGRKGPVDVETFFRPGMNLFFRRRRPVATVAFNMVPRRGPYGGGNQWLHQLSSYLTSCGYAVQFRLDENVDCVAGTHAGLGGPLAFRYEEILRKGQKSSSGLHSTHQ